MPPRGAGRRPVERSHARRSIFFLLPGVGRMRLRRRGEGARFFPFVFSFFPLPFFPSRQGWAGGAGCGGGQARPPLLLPLPLFSVLFPLFFHRARFRRGGWAARRSFFLPFFHVFPQPARYLLGPRPEVGRRVPPSLSPSPSFPCPPGGGALQEAGQARSSSFAFFFSVFCVARGGCHHRS